MKFLIDFIKGVFVGIANIIPGVSGGTMAVSFGIYDKILSAISNLLKDFKNSVKALFPIMVGMAFGIVSFTYIIPWLLEHEPFITSMAFTGLILGGLPMLVKSLKESWTIDEHKSSAVCFIIFLTFAFLSVAMLFFNGSSDSGVLLDTDISTLVILFFMGLIASATMIIPGVSGSLILMILGYYFGIISAIKDFLSALKDMDFDNLVKYGIILLPFGVGCVLGIFFISKWIKWMLKHFPSATFCAILGLVVTSPFSIFYKVNQEYSLSGTKPFEIIVSIIIFLVCLGVTLIMGKMDSSDDEVVKA